MHACTPSTDPHAHVRTHAFTDAHARRGSHGRVHVHAHAPAHMGAGDSWKRFCKGGDRTPTD